MLKYSFKEPVTFKANAKADPQQIGEALALIAEQSNGELTPLAVVTAAKDVASPLNQHFEWDDAKAAHAFRLDQARGIIRSIVCEETESDDAPTHAFLSISDKGGVSYRTVQSVRKSRELQALVLKQAERDLEAFERRYRELSDVCEHVRTARELIVQKRDVTESNAAAQA